LAAAKSRLFKGDNMPGFLTHYIAGQNLIQSVASPVTEIIKSGEKLFNLGSQGPDIFFYYFPGQLRKRSRGVGSHMHESDLGVFLAYMARLAKEAPAQDKDIIFAYTSGFIMHYALDSHAHPYVYAMTHNEGAPKIKNSADHRKFETAIDVAMLELMGGKKPAELKQWELINAEACHMCTAAAALSLGVYQVYNRDVPPKVVHRAMRHTVHFTRLIQSKTGRRKRWMELVENMTIRQPLFSSMIHMQALTEGFDYLNTRKAPWIAPWPKAESQTDSFVDRYNAAVREAVLLVTGLHDYVYGDLPAEDLVKKLGNRSLKTGMPCEMNLAS